MQDLGLLHCVSVNGVLHSYDDELCIMYACVLESVPAHKNSEIYYPPECVAGLFTYYCVYPGYFCLRTHTWPMHIFCAEGKKETHN